MFYFLAFRGFCDEKVFHINTVAFDFFCYFAQAADDEAYPVRAKVVELLEDTGNEVNTPAEGYYYESQFVRVQILEGEHKGKTVVAEHSTTAYFTDYETYRLKKGDRVFITYYLDENGEPVDVYVTDLVREGYLLFLAALFVFLIWYWAEAKGLKRLSRCL